jgi:hypothetical protein
MRIYDCKSVNQFTGVESTYSRKAYQWTWRRAFPNWRPGWRRRICGRRVRGLTCACLRKRRTARMVDGFVCGDRRGIGWRLRRDRVRQVRGFKRPPFRRLSTFFCFETTQSTTFAWRIWRVWWERFLCFSVRSTLWIRRKNASADGLIFCSMFELYNVHFQNVLAF